MDRPQPPRSRPARRRRAAAVLGAPLARLWPDRPSTARGTWAQARPHFSLITRLTAATVITYALLHAVSPTLSRDLTGPLTALLVTQASSAGTVKMGLVRVGAVMTGVLVAVAVASVVGLTWWSLAIVVALALSVATILRLHEQLLEAPISAMLILGASTADQAAETRVVLTLVGAGVGTMFGLLLPPSLPISLAASRVRQVGDHLADDLAAAGRSLAEVSPTRATVDGWTADLRQTDPLIAEARQVIEALSSGRRFNTRALTAADVAPLLGSGLETLDNCLLAVRSLFLQIRSELPADPRSGGYDDDLRLVFAVVMQHAAESIRGFGALVDAEAEGNQDEAQQSLNDSLEMLGEAKAILTELMLTGPGTTTWLLRGSVLSAVEQVLLQLDLEQRSLVHAEWKDEQSRRFAAHLPVLVRDALPQAERPLPRLLERGLLGVVRAEVSRRALRRGRDFLVPDIRHLSEAARDAIENGPRTAVSGPAAADAAPDPRRQSPVRPAHHRQAPDRQAPDRQAPDEQAPDRPAPDEQAPAKQAPGRSAFDRAALDRPAHDRPAHDRPAHDRPGHDRSAEDRSADDKSADDRPSPQPGPGRD